MLKRSKYFDIEYDLDPEDELLIEVTGDIEEMRILKGWTQAELAKRVGTTQSSIARLEAGFSLPSMKMLVRLAEAFGTTLIAPKFAGLDNLRSMRLKEIDEMDKKTKGKRLSRRGSHRNVNDEAIYADSKSGSIASAA